MLGAHIIGNAQPHVRISDLFTEASTTGLDAHTPDTDESAAGWTEVSGVWEVSKSGESNKLAIAVSGAGTNEEYATIDATVFPTLITCDVVSPALFLSNGESDIVFGYLDTSNHYIARIVWTTNQIAIGKYVSGVWTTYETKSSTFSVDTSYSATITIDGSSVSFTINGVTVSGTLNESTLDAETVVGLKGMTYASAGRTMRYDNFEVTG